MLASFIHMPNGKGLHGNDAVDAFNPLPGYQRVLSLHSISAPTYSIYIRNVLRAQPVFPCAILFLKINLNRFFFIEAARMRRT